MLMTLSISRKKMIIELQEKKTSEIIDPVDTHIGKKLRLLRVMSNLTQAELAEALGVTYQQVQKYESGQTRISASRLYDLSNDFKVSLDYFFEGLLKVMQENDQEPFTYEASLPSDKGGIELMKAFYRIKNPKLRKVVIDLAKTLGDDDQNIEHVVNVLDTLEKQ
jgi:transcriptional regulator with XRE-family HTH domain